VIDAGELIERTRKHGFGLWTGVPCSYLTPLINCAIAHPHLRWVTAANEGDAVATAAGAALAGQRSVAIMQNSGLGNAVNPLASLTYTMRIPVLLIVTLRGDPELRDEPQHELMGTITERMLGELRIPCERFPREPAALGAALERACKHMAETSRPYAFVLRKGDVGWQGRPDASSESRAAVCVEHRPRGAGSAEPTRAQALRRIVDATPESSSAVIATTGYTGRELAAIADRANQLYMVGSMGCASSLALGVALTHSRLRVVAVDGDGAALMRMGNFATLGAYGGDNLVHVVLDNGVHESTGGQRTVSRAISFAGVAAACGYGLALEGDSVEMLDELFEARSPRGPRFGVLRIRPGVDPEPPRPQLGPEQVRTRFSEHLRKVATP